MTNLTFGIIVFIINSINAVSVKSDCLWIGGSYGQALTCNSGYMVTGVCGSGSNPDCSGYHHKIQCCPVDTVSSCTWYDGKYGVMINCPSGDAANGMCGSGKNADCRVGGSNAYEGVNCCEMSTKTVSGDKFLVKGKFGESITCPSGQVVVSSCGSGSNADCDSVSSEMGIPMGSGYYTAIKCQPFQ